MLSIDQLWIIAAIAVVSAVALLLVKVDGKVKLDWWPVLGIALTLLLIAFFALYVSVKMIQSA